MIVVLLNAVRRRHIIETCVRCNTTDLTFSLFDKELTIFLRYMHSKMVENWPDSELFTLDVNKFVNDFKSNQKKEFNNDC